MDSCGRARRQVPGLSELLDGVGLEWDSAGRYGALVVAVDVAAEERVVEFGFEHRHGQQVAAQGECVEGEAEAIDADPTVGESLVHRCERLEVGVVERETAAIAL